MVAMNFSAFVRPRHWPPECVCLRQPTGHCDATSKGNLCDTPERPRSTNIPLQNQNPHVLQHAQVLVHVLHPVRRRVIDGLHQRVRLPSVEVEPRHHTGRLRRHVAETQTLDAARRLQLRPRRRRRPVGAARAETRSRDKHQDRVHVSSVLYSCSPTHPRIFILLDLEARTHCCYVCFLAFFT